MLSWLQILCLSVVVVVVVCPPPPPPPPPNPIEEGENTLLYSFTLKLQNKAKSWIHPLKCEKRDSPDYSSSADPLSVCISLTVLLLWLCKSITFTVSIITQTQTPAKQ